MNDAKYIAKVVFIEKAIEEYKQDLIKALPEQREKYLSDGDYYGGFDEGYNACLKEIKDKLNGRS